MAFSKKEEFTKEDIWLADIAKALALPAWILNQKLYSPFGLFPILIYLLLSLLFLLVSLPLFLVSPLHFFFFIYSFAKLKKQSIKYIVVVDR